MGLGFDRILQTAFAKRKGLSTGTSRPPWMRFARWGGIVGVMVVAGSLFGGYSHWSGQTAQNPIAPPQVSKPSVAPATAAAPVTAPVIAKREPLKLGTRYVRRNNSVLRAAAKASAKALARKAKGTAVTVLSVSADGWAEVQDGPLHGYMRASILGAPP